MDNGDSPEGKSDEHPVVLPSTITCAEFDVYLWFRVQSVNFSLFWAYLKYVMDVCTGTIKAQPKTT